MVLLFAVFSGPLGEEPGWRGFALPRLLSRYPALTASLILGVVWAAWHIPLLLVGDLTVYGTVNAVLAAIVFTWVYQNTGGSVLIPILMHMSHQNSVRYLGKVFAEPDHTQQQWIAVAIWALVVVAIIALAGTAQLRKPARSGWPATIRLPDPRKSRWPARSARAASLICWASALTHRYIIDNSSAARRILRPEQELTDTHRPMQPDRAARSGRRRPSLRSSSRSASAT